MLLMQLCPGTEIFRPVYSRLLLNSVLNISSHLQSQIFRILKMANQKNPPKTTNQPTTYYFSGEFKACKIIATDIWNVPTLQVYSKPLKVYRKENKECWRASRGCRPENLHCSFWWAGLPVLPQNY